MRSLDYLATPLPKTDITAREKLARGASLEEVYPDDFSEIEIPLQENVKNSPYTEINLTKYIPVSGATSIKVELISTPEFSSREEKCYLQISQGGRNYQEFIGTFQSEEKPELTEENLEDFKRTLEERGYEVQRTGSNLNLLGYSNNQAKLNAMKKIYSSLHPADQIPQMKAFLRTNFPRSNYSPGQEHDLDKISGAAIALQFNRKYNSIRRTL